MIFTNTEQISRKFIEDGWNKNTSFVEVSLDEAKENGYLFMINNITEGKKYFRMKANGNIYDNKGEIVLYNIKTMKPEKF